MIHDIMIQDLEINEILTQSYINAGTPHIRRVKYGMPKISQGIVASVFICIITTKMLQVVKTLVVLASLLVIGIITMV